MPFYHIATDAISVTIEADGPDAAARKFAESENLPPDVCDVPDLRDYLESHDGWLHIEELAGKEAP